ncbi:unknown [Firmicutes bacterium CAG:103]|nr:unknown [Firmicutes bacterium CAG:103]
MTRLHWLGAALLFLGSTAAGFALRQELRLRLRLLTAVIDSLNLLRSDIVGCCAAISSAVCCRCRRRCAIWRRARPSR